MRATTPSLAVLLLFLITIAPLGGSACHVGDSPADDDSGDDGSDDGTSGPDAAPTGDDGADDDGTDDGDDDGGDDGGEIDVTACRDLVPEGQLVDGHHPGRFDYNNGDEKGCIQGACHGSAPGPAAPVYTIGGAVYQDVTEGRPVAGATVYVTDKNGLKRALVTSENGFFWSTEALTPPFALAVTAGCPDEPIPMMATAAGNCNGGGGCHVPTRQIYSEL